MEKKSSKSQEKSQMLTQLRIYKLLLKGSKLSRQGNALNAIGNETSAIGSAIASIGSFISSEGAFVSAQGSSIQSYGSYLSVVGNSTIIEGYKIQIAQALKQLQSQGKGPEYCESYEKVQDIRKMVLQLQLHMEYLEHQLTEALRILEMK